MLLVANRSICPIVCALCKFCLKGRFYFTAGISCHPLIDDVLKRCNFALAFFTVHAVVNRYVADIMAGEVQFRVLPRHNVISAKTGEVFCNYTVDFSGFNICNHALKIRSVKVCSRPPVIYVLVNNVQMVFSGIGAEHTSLCRDTGAFPL